MKRITIVAHGLGGGGAERVASLLANKLYSKGNQIQYIAVYSDEKKYQLQDGIEFVQIRQNVGKATRFLKRTIEIDRCIERFKSDIVVSFIFKELLLTAAKNNVPVIYSLRIDPVTATRTRAGKALCYYTYKRSKAVVFQTKGARDFFPQSIRGKGTVIGNPLTPDLPYWNKQNHVNRIVTACRLTEQKNLPMLINGFAEFSKSFPDYELYIYGEGPLKEELYRLAEKDGISGKAYFPGYTKEIHKAMAQAAMFVSTSDFEGLSNSMLEALAIGVPTICTDCPPGGASEYITDGENGLLIPVGDVKALTEKMTMVAKDPGFAEKLSYDAVKIRDSLDIDRIIEKWENVLYS